MSAHITRLASSLPWTVPATIALLLLLALLDSPPAGAQVVSSDVSAALAKDETPGDMIPWSRGIDNDADTLVDEDPTLNGIDEDGDRVDGEDPPGDVVRAGEVQQVPVELAYTAGVVSDSLILTATIAGPVGCDPRWIGVGEQVSVMKLGSLQLSRILWIDVPVAAGETLTVVRKYSLSCPAGSHAFNVFAQAGSATGIADAAPLNNLAENQLQVIATADVDGDGIPNELDSCDWTPDSGLDTDGDGIADACGADDDGDDFSDIAEAFIGTDPLRACAQTPTADDENAPDSWPPDFTDDGKVTVSDALAFKPLFQGFVAYVPRFDLDTNGVIDLRDVGVLRQYLAASCYPG